MLCYRGKLFSLIPSVGIVRAPSFPFVYSPKCVCCKQTFSLDIFAAAVFCVLTCLLVRLWWCDWTLFFFQREEFHIWEDEESYPVEAGLRCTQAFLLISLFFACLLFILKWWIKYCNLEALIWMVFTQNLDLAASQHPICHMHFFVVSFLVDVSQYSYQLAKIDVYKFTRFAW